MGGTGKHAMSAPVRSAPGRRAGQARGLLRFPTRLGVTTTVALLVALTAIIVGVVLTKPSGTGQAGSRPAGQMALMPFARANAVPAIIGRGQRIRAMTTLGVAARARLATMPLVLTALDHQECPAAAAACVDLTRHITWLQANGRIAFGPVQMEPGQPGSAHQTPRGTFQVSWKAGPSLISNIYDEPMPWATFFAPGGIAFHGGSLTAWSHGCVHLTVSNAHYYNEHLPIGAEVVVF